MTDRQLQKRVKWWTRQLHELGLEHWDLHIKIVPDGEVQGRQADAMAAVVPSDMYDSAWIEFAKRTTELDGDTLDKIIVHELLHIVMRDHDRVLEAALGTLGGQLEEHYDNLMRQEQEGVVERLARTIVMFNVTLQKLVN